MTTKVTKRSVLNSGNIVVSIPYCELQTLLRDCDPTGYTSDSYGWGADVYEFDGVTLVTGYRPFGHGVSREILEKYEQMARQIVGSYSYHYEQIKSKLNDLIRSFIDEVVGSLLAAL